MLPILTRPALWRLVGAYFAEASNVFDFFIVVSSLLGVFMEGSGVNASALRVFRVFRIGRTLRVLKETKERYCPSPVPTSAAGLDTGPGLEGKQGHPADPGSLDRFRWLIHE